MENEGKENLEQEQPASSKKVKKVNISKVIKITWKVIEKIIMIAILFISLVIITQRLSNNEKAFLGYRLFRVQTGSMIPKYQIGDVILVKEKEIDDIKIGDDVTYDGTSGLMKGKLVTHQVINIEELEGKKVFHTKGIANKLEDPIIYGNQINGVVQGKSYILTTIVSLLSNKYIFYFGAILPITIIIFFSVIKANVKRYEQKQQ